MRLWRLIIRPGIRDVKQAHCTEQNIRIVRALVVGGEFQNARVKKRKIWQWYSERSINQYFQTEHKINSNINKCANQQIEIFKNVNSVFQCSIRTNINRLFSCRFNI